MSRTFTDKDRIAANNLRRVWNLKKRQLGLTQEKAAVLFGGTQGLISSYLLGRAALGKVATLRFARILQVPPETIRDDMDFSDCTLEEWPEDVLKAARMLAAMPESMRQDIEKAIQVMASSLTHPTGSKTPESLVRSES